MRKNNVQNLKARTKPQLTVDQVQQVTEKVMGFSDFAIEHAALMTLLLDHLEQVEGESRILFVSTIGTIKRQLFATSEAGSNAQARFQAEVFANRAKVLQGRFGRRRAS